MKAITLIQPYASLVVDGRKRIETRSWPTRHRGKVAVHAGSKINRKECLRFGYNPDTIPRSAVLGTAIITDCVRFPHPKAPPDPYGNFARGRYGFILENVHKFSRPIPGAGWLNLWNWRRRPVTQAKIRHNAAAKAWAMRRTRLSQVGLKHLKKKIRSRR